MFKELDGTDFQLLNYLQENAGTSHSELARRLGLSVTGLQKRVRKLENAGIIQQYTTRVNHEAAGFDMLCFIQVTLHRHELNTIADFKQRIQTIPEVLECHHITGEYDYLLKVVVKNRKHLEQFLMETLTPVPGMDKIRTSLVLSEIKSTTVLPWHCLEKV